MRRSNGAGHEMHIARSIVGLLVGLLAVATAAAQERREQHDFGPPPREFRGPEGPRGGPPPFGRSFDFVGDTSVTKGFVFIEGEYVPPPYEIRYSDGTLSINDRPLKCIPPPRNTFSGFGGRGGGSRNGESSWRWIMGELAGQLGSDLVIVSFENQPYVSLDSDASHNLLKSMLMQHGRSVGQVSVIERLPADFDKKVWDKWVVDFQMPDILKNRAAATIASYESAQRQAQAEIRARKWMEALSYPLSVGGMVLCVLAIGHLLGGRPHAGQPTVGTDNSEIMLRALNWSLLFTAAFSLFDLAWTIVAANANQMLELNPIGSHLIQDPRHLAGFKIGVTLPALALLWLLRRHKRAQIAAWWVCLVLTLVTVRWLTISTTFPTSYG